MSQTTHAPHVGESLPEIVLPSLDGSMVRLSDYLGQRLLMFMWASW